jgi:hypothetical protein
VGVLSSECHRSVLNSVCLNMLIYQIFIISYDYIVYSFHLESPMRLVKRLTHDFEIVQPMRSTTIQP